MKIALECGFSGWPDPPRCPVFHIPKAFLIASIIASKAFIFLEGYDLVLLILGRSILVASVLPRLLFDKPLTLPMVLLALGFAVFALPLGLEFPAPLEQGKLPNG